MIAFLAMIPAFALGWIVVRLLTPRPGGFFAWLLDLSLGVAVGAGISSIFDFLLTWAGLASRISLAAAELIGICASGFALYRSREPAIAETSRPSPSWIWLLRLAVVAGLALLSLDFSETLSSSPAGEWDAFGIWNLRARYLAGGAESWHRAFSGDMAAGMIGASHPAYPLLVSGFIARTWTILGDAHAAAPAVLSFVFTLATLGVLAGALATSSEILALLALLVVLATDTFVSQAAAQESDIPLSCFLVGATAMLAFAAERQWPPGLLALAGLLAGFAAWTKNEGLPFAIAVIAISFWRAKFAAKWMVAGAAAPILATLALKSFLVQGTESMFPRSVAQAGRLIVDAPRWGKIIASFARNFWNLGPIWAHPILLLAIVWFVFGLVAAKDRRWWLFAAPLALLAADFGIYLISTADLDWHLNSSNSRLIAQVWPALIFVFFTLLRAPVVAGAKPVQEQPSRKKR